MLKALENYTKTKSFDQFAKESYLAWESIAKYLMRKWKCPAGVELADVIQELLLNAWRNIDKFDATRSSNYKRFLVFNATQYTKIWMQKQRNTFRRKDTEPARVPVLLEDISGPELFEDPVQYYYTALIDFITKRGSEPVVIHLCNTGFDEKRAIRLLVADGKSRQRAKKLVQATVQEIKLLW